MSREAHVRFCERPEGRFLRATRLALFHDDPRVLESWRQRIADYLVGRRLLLHPRKTAIAATTEPATFLGLVLVAPHLRRLPEDKVARFRNRLRGLRDRWRAGAVTQDEVRQRVQSWIAHASHANTWRLRHAIFRAGWFDPAVADLTLAREA